ncbi:MAG: serine hydrolase [Planctomycetota bacterium]|nr:serine hydrolase [Planctomycetota bacterium]
MKLAQALVSLAFAALALLCPAQPVTPGDSTNQAAQPAAAAPHDQHNTITAPDTDAGKQLAWFVAALNGAPLGDITTRFTPEFIAQVPQAKLEELVTALRAGEFKVGATRIDVREGNSPAALRASVQGATGISPVTLAVNPDGRMHTLFIGAAVPTVKSWDEVKTRLAALPGSTAMYVARLGAAGWDDRAEVFAKDAFAPGAIGSTFKLWVLGALAEQVAAGRAAWDEQLAVSDALKSLPSGTMQVNPEGTMFTLEHFATQMISISDNTAADHLLLHVGREAAEAFMARCTASPERNRPMLSTLDMFKLKLSGDDAAVAAWLAADESTRRSMLATGGRVNALAPIAAKAMFWKKPFKIDQIEWFASPIDCARAMAELHHLEQQREQQPGQDALGRALRKNPGIMLGAQWTSAAFKGGSEPGVINLTWLLRRSDEQWFAVSMTWNNPKASLDEAAFIGLASGAISLLAQQPAR